jgi:hypothetical protein
MIVISEVLVFEDWSVGISKHIESFYAVLENPGTEIAYDALTSTEENLIEEAIWKEYYKIQDERIGHYGYNNWGLDHDMDELLAD